MRRDVMWHAPLRTTIALLMLAPFACSSEGALDAAQGGRLELLRYYALEYTDTSRVSMYWKSRSYGRSTTTSSCLYAQIFDGYLESYMLLRKLLAARSNAKLRRVC